MRYYQTQPGDTIKKVATRFGISPNLLCRYNHLKNPRQWLHQGHILCIPCPGSFLPFPSGWPGEMMVYVVQTNENLEIVSKKFKTEPETILTANNLTSPTQVFPGQVLHIPIHFPVSETVPACTQEPVVRFQNDWCMLFWIGAISAGIIPLYIGEINLLPERPEWSDQPDRWEVRVFANGREITRNFPVQISRPPLPGSSLPPGFTFVFQSDLMMSQLAPYHPGTCYLEALAWYLPKQFYLWQEIPLNRKSGGSNPV